MQTFLDGTMYIQAGIHSLIHGAKAAFAEFIFNAIAIFENGV
jgi:hypothetical protein